MQQQPVPDYPRPRSPPARSNAGEGAEAGGDTEDKGLPDQRNRQERRRQERKKDKYQTEEDKAHVVHGGFPYDAKHAGKETKSAMGADRARRSSAGASGVRITQPMGKFMT